MASKEIYVQYLVIGADPSGEAAANRLADLGGEVVVVERDLVGGTCVNKGFIPVQFMIRHLLLISRFLKRMNGINCFLLVLRSM